MTIQQGGRCAAALAVIGALGVLPAVASARTKTVEVGPYGKAAQKSFQKANSDANAFFRKTITIHRGDRVKWNINGFHSVTFVPKGGKPPALITPDSAAPLSGINDAAGNPFWFNGQPSLELNPQAAFKQGGSTFSASKLANSGLPLDEGKPKPYTLRFNTAGTFRYLCVVHPGMTGTVKVVGRSKRVPSTAADKREAAREQSRVLKEVKSLSTGLGTSSLQNTIQAGNDKRDGAAVYDFFPHNPSFKVGTTVTLRMSPSSTEDHTISFGPTNGKSAYLDQIANDFIKPVPGGSGPPTLLVKPEAAYPSENPANGVPAFDGTNHGNGFHNSGVLDADAQSPLPGDTKVTFTAPGTYKFICLIHPFMRGTVTITP